VAVPSTNVLSLCSGGGGLDVGFKLAVPESRPVCYVENEVTAAGVLAHNMEQGSLGEAPVWTDIRTFSAEPWRGIVDCVIGGYPCQPFSTAGKQLGTADPRHLWPYINDIISVVEPAYCFFENVAVHLTNGFDEVAGSLQGMGFEVAAGIFTASEIGAPHLRERLFILAAHSQRARVTGLGASEVPSLAGPWQWRGKEDLQSIIDAPFERNDRWPKPLLRGVDDGLANRYERLQVLGNGVVPQQAAYALRVLASALEY
jgi:DNA (cytosine-5)-methyltransferase 1